MKNKFLGLHHQGKFIVLCLVLGLTAVFMALNAALALTSQQAVLGFRLSAYSLSLAADCGAEPVESCGASPSFDSACIDACDVAASARHDGGTEEGSWLHYECQEACKQKFNDAQRAWGACYKQYKQLSDNYRNCINQQRAQQAEQQRQAQLEEQRRQAELQEQQRQAEAEQQKQATPQAPPTPELTPAPTTALKPKDEIKITTMYYSEIKNGDTVTAGPHERVIIYFSSGQRIELDENSSFQKWDEREVKSFFGRLYISIRRPFSVSTRYASTGVRGTKFSIDAQDKETTVRVIEGVVAVSDLKKKKTVNVKAGYEVVASGATVGKPTPVDSSILNAAWYDTIPPETSFWEESWKKTSALQSYKQECATSFDSATTKDTLAADEQAAMDSFNAMSSKLRIKVVRAVDLVGKKLYASNKKIDADGSTKAATLYVSANKIYYPGAKAKTWKSFAEPDSIKTIFSEARADTLTKALDNTSFNFYRWNTIATARLAAYVGSLSFDGTARFIKNTLGTDSQAGQSQASHSVILDEETKLPRSSATKVSIKTGKLLIPVTQVCSMSYGLAARITLPAKAATVSAAVGNEELGKMFQSAL